MSDPIFADDFRDEPYWWRLAAPTAVPAAALPPRVDVAIIGSGLTAMSAALTLLRGGRSVAVLDKDLPGFGAARRNAGYIGRTLKKSFPELLRGAGPDYAIRVYRELDLALQTVRAVIAEEEIDCHLVRCGRFIAATSAAHYEQMARDLEVTRQHLGFPFHMVPRSEQRSEIGSDAYFGGAVIPDLGALHPGLYHKGMQERVLAAGGIVSGNTEVLRVSAEGDGVTLETSRGRLAAAHAVVATNGYTPRGFRWHARRVIPFTGYMVATDLLPEAVMKRILPHRRTVIDSNVDIDFIRPAPDSPRMLYGGLTGSGMSGTAEIARRLRARIARVLPDLATARLANVWSGQCAGTFDMMPHMGREGRVWHALGYNFAGVPMGTYLGRKIAEGILERPGADSVFAGRRFPTLPFYSGNPWFVPHAMRYFGWRDRRFAARRSGEGEFRP